MRKTKSLEQIIVVLWPPLFPMIMLQRDKKNIAHIYFSLLCVAQWVIYASSMKNIYLGMFVANIGLLMFYFFNPYNHSDLHKYYTKDSVEMLDTLGMRIGLTVIVLYVIPALLGEIAVDIVKTFFINEILFYNYEISNSYIKWGVLHRALAWLCVIGYCLLQIKNKQIYEFDMFFFNRDEEDINKANLTGIGGLYFLFAFVVAIIVGTAWGAEHSIGLIWAK